ncbi:MAG: alpha/beta hydrolase-fold protein [Planctomycetota bacterium]
MRKLLRPFVLLVVLFLPTALSADQGLSFQLTFDPKLHSEPFTGRVLIFMSDEFGQQPRLQQSWTSRQPIFGAQVKDWKPGETLTITDPIGYPYALADLPPKKYAIQAVMHLNPDQPHSGKAIGNLYSKPIKQDLDPALGGSIELNITKIVKEPTDRPLPPRAKLVEFKSKLLSGFHHRDITMRAIVMPPTEYETNPDEKFPAIYVIPGFGGDERQAAMMAAMYGKPAAPMVKVCLDGMWALGHHVYADSDNNGPWGKALTEELIPHLEKEFRLIPESRARFLTGHSSGGWSSLWLQVAYPDFFGGVWSTSPDPVTFKDFCGTDLYDPEANFYTDADGKLRPMMRRKGKVVVVTRDSCRAEEVLGPGDQYFSFEAVFSPRGPNGMPRQLWNRKTGKLDRKTVESWKRYDIVEKLKKEWPEIGPKLKGKLTIIMGDEDTFYLEGATRILKDELEKLGSDARAIIVPGKDHGTIMFTKPFRAMMKEMSEQFTGKPEDATTSKPSDEE